ncbi:MAG: SDR family oxidoreductase [Campylobacterales bacterium]|nr:SDR family oxidoreductase [Campylobacterales bacterium]
MKIVVLGASGMLGSQLVKYLGQYHDVVGISRTAHPLSSYTCDFTNFDRLNSILNRVNANVIVNCSAITNITYCEQNIYDAFSLHFYLPCFLSQRHEKNIYISTDSVFSGKSGNYDETSAPHPLNTYSMSKLMGETPILDSGGLVLRSNIYGFNAHKEGNSLFEWAVRQVVNNQETTGYTDVMFNPVSIFSLSRIIASTLEKEGLYHIGSNLPISKCEFLQYVINLVNPKFSRLQFGTQPDSLVKRPKNTTLNIKKSQNEGVLEVDLTRDLEETVSLYLEQLRSYG